MKIKMMKQIRFCSFVCYFLMAFFALVGITSCSFKGDDDLPRTFRSDGVLTAKCLNYGYHFTKAEDRGGESFEILCNGTETVYSTSADYLSFISATQNDDGDNNDEIKPRDIDGDMIPDLIIQETNGNCCLDYTVISLGDNLRKYELQEVGAEFELVDLNDDGKFEIKTTDTTFFTHTTGSKFDEPVPEVILESKNGRYVFSQKFMKDISPVNIFEQTNRAKKKFAATGEIPPLDKKLIIELIYHGQGSNALKYLDAVYDKTSYEAAKNEMADDIVLSLLRSPHWEEISAMNKWKYTQPDDGELACPEFAGRGWLERTR